MSENKWAILAIIVFLIVQGTFFVYTTENLNSRTIKYDCGMAEWHPDIPVGVKEDCRKLRAKQSGRL